MSVKSDIGDNDLEEVVPNNVWILNGSLVYPIVGRFPVRMAVIRLNTKDDKLVIWSPLPPSDYIIKQIEALGVISYIVAPNSMHWMGILPFINKCSNKETIKVCIAPGLASKKEVIDAGIKWDYTLTETAPIEFENEIQMKFIPGIPTLDEIILYHIKSKTLIVTDLAFNFSKQDPKINVTGIIIPLYLTLAGGYRSTCLTRPFWYIIQDFDAAYTAMEEVMEDFDFDCIILAHGSIVTTNAKDKLRNGTVALLKEWREASSSSTTSNTINPYVIAGIALTVGLSISYFAGKKR